jgi:tetratricopeptide (TPR) repeat protein
MTEINVLLEDVTRLIASEKPSLVELRVKMVELDEFVHSAEFEGLSYDDRTRFQSAYKELRDCIHNLENPSKPGEGSAAPSFETSLAGAPAVETATSSPPSAAQAASLEAREHNAFAEQQMEEAEKMFYGGRYAEAIKLYDQVLQIEPKWERARQHRGESENYLRTGYIPSVALPAEAASAFGKAQSAARLGRYADAMSLLIKAQIALRDMGIQRWQDGQEFEQKLQQYIDAESVYSEGLQLFSQGMIDDGIERVEAAAQATGLPKYNDRAQDMRKAKAAMQSIAESLNTPVTDPKDVAKMKSDLDGLYLQFGDNPAFTKHKERLQSIIPAVVEPLKDQARSLKTQADQAQTLDAVVAKARQARQAIDQARSLGYSDAALDQLQDDIDKLFRDVQRYEDELQQATTVYNTNRSWPAAAAQISQDVRARYPNDPRVIELNRSLQPYKNARLAIRAGIILIGLIVLAGLLLFGVNRTKAYLLSLTPTATSTFTTTPTGTPLPSTATATPRPTLTPTLTPTPLMGVVSRDVYVRNGCYETYKAIGKIPAGSTVRFLPADRRYDNINRECLLVEFTGPDQTTLVGWILIADIGQ